jgi:hypothetical protein
MAVYAISTGTTDLTQQMRYVRYVHIRDAVATPGAQFKLSLANGSGGAAVIIQGQPWAGYDLVYLVPRFFPLGVYVTSITGTWTGEIEGY